MDCRWVTEYFWRSFGAILLGIPERMYTIKSISPTAIIQYLFPIPISVADNTNTVLVITVALLVKIFTSITHVLLLSSTAEFVPAKYRKSLLLSCTVCGRTCLLTASFIGSLTLVSAVRPFVVFALMGTIGGFALCILDPSVKLRQRNKSIEMDEMGKLTGQ